MKKKGKLRVELLGEIESVIAGSQYFETDAEPGEVVHLERDSDNRHDPKAILVENEAEESLGYVPRRISSWLAPPARCGTSHC